MFLLILATYRLRFRKLTKAEHVGIIPLAGASNDNAYSLCLELLAVNAWEYVVHAPNIVQDD